MTLPPEDTYEWLMRQQWGHSVSGTVVFAMICPLCQSLVAVTMGARVDFDPKDLHSRDHHFANNHETPEETSRRNAAATKENP